MGSLPVDGVFGDISEFIGGGIANVAIPVAKGLNNASEYIGGMHSKLNPFAGKPSELEQSYSDWAERASGKKLTTVSDKQLRNR